MSIFNLILKTAQIQGSLTYFGNEIVHFLCYLLYLIVAVVTRVAIHFPENLLKNLCGISDLYANNSSGDGAVESWTYHNTESGVTTEIGTKGGVSTDIVLAFIRDNSVQDTFWAILGFSIVLLLILTIIAIFRSEFTLDPSKAAKGPIIARAFKGLGSFLLVPVMSIGFIYVVNLSIRAVNSLTTGGGSIVVRIFELTTEGANRVYLEKDKSGGYGKGSFAYYLVNNGNVSTDDYKTGTFEPLKFISGTTSSGTGQTAGGTGNDSAGGSSTTTGIALLFKDIDGTNYNAEGGGTGRIKLGDAVEQLFSFDLSTIGKYKKDGDTWKPVVDTTSKGEYSYINTSDIRNVKFNTKPCTNFTEAQEFADNNTTGYYVPWQTWLVKLPTDMNKISYAMFKGKLVSFFYDPSEMNLIVGGGAAVILGLNYLGVVVMLLKRALELVILFVISPVAIAMYPLDDGSATNNWRKQFRNRLIAPVSVVFVYNIFFTLLELLDFDKFKFLTSLFGADTFLRLFFNVLVVCVASKLLTTASKIISDLLGIEDMVGGSSAALKGAIGTMTGAVRGGITAVTMPGRVVGATRRFVNKVHNARKNYSQNKAHADEDRDKKRAEYDKYAQEERDMAEAKSVLDFAKETGNQNDIAEAQKIYDEKKKIADSHAVDRMKAKAAYDQAVMNSGRVKLLKESLNTASASRYQGKRDRITREVGLVDAQLHELENKGDADSEAKRKELEAQKAELLQADALNESRHARISRRTRGLGFIGLNVAKDTEKRHQKPLKEVGEMITDSLGSLGESTGVSDLTKIVFDDRERTSKLLPTSMAAASQQAFEKKKKQKENEEYLEQQRKIMNGGRESDPEKRYKAAKDAIASTASKREAEKDLYTDAARQDLLNNDSELSDLLARKAAIENRKLGGNRRQKIKAGKKNEEDLAAIESSIEARKAVINSDQTAIENRANELFNTANRVNNKNRFNSDISESESRKASDFVNSFKSEAQAAGVADAQSAHDAYITGLNHQIQEALKAILESSRARLGGMSSSDMEKFINKLKDPLAQAVKNGVISAQKEQNMNTNRFNVKGEMGVLIEQIKALNTETSRKGEDINAIIELLKELENRINNSGKKN